MLGPSSWSRPTSSTKQAVTGSRRNRDFLFEMMRGARVNATRKPAKSVPACCVEQRWFHGQGLTSHSYYWLPVDKMERKAKTWRLSGQLCDFCVSVDEAEAELPSLVRLNQPSKLLK